MTSASGSRQSCVKPALPAPLRASPPTLRAILRRTIPCRDYAFLSRWTLWPGHRGQGVG